MPSATGGGMALHSTNTAQKLFQERRRQNQLLISINCSKAIDANKYQELVEILNNGGQPNMGSESPLIRHQQNRSLSLSSAGAIKPQIRYANQNKVNSRQNVNPIPQKYNRGSIIDIAGQYQTAQMINPIKIREKNEQISSYSSEQPKQGSKVKKYQQSYESVIKHNKGQDNLHDSTSKIQKFHTDLSDKKRSSNSKALSSSIDQSTLYTKAKSQTRVAMYDRAMQKLKILLKSKGLKEPSVNESNFDLYHFHIEANDNNIQLNKFDNCFQQLDTDQSVLINRSLNLPSGNTAFPQAHRKLRGAGRDSVEYDNLKIDISSLEKVKSQKVKRQETEEKISENLLKASPNMRLVKRQTMRNEQFMMNIKSTQQDESIDQDFTTKQNETRKDKTQKTILYVKEIDDNDKDYLQMEIKEFIKLSREELIQAYNRLQKSINVVFSGSVNTLINKIDFRKINNEFNTQKTLNSYRNYNNGNNQNEKKFNEVEKELIDELKQCREDLDKKNMIYGQWSILNQQGPLPDSREGATACVLDSSLYLFGGFSRDLFNDMRIYDLNQQKWRILNFSYGTPHARFAHSMLQYGHKLYIFGGAGTYIQSIKMRLSFNDIHIFDTQSEQWLKEPEIEGAPRKRMNHAAGIFGCIMLVHGGFNTEQKKLLNDFGLFDIERNKWIDCRVYLEGNRIDDKHFHYDHLNDDVIGYRQMHTITTICDQEYYQENFTGLRKKKVMWLKKRTFSEEERELGYRFTEGMYLFGGANQKGQVFNDLWIIQPYYKENEKILSVHSSDYLTKPILMVQVKKIRNFKGRPPCPRIQHNATVLKDWNKHYLLVIYGGRNDSIFSKTQNVALNDICIYNVNKSEWIALAMYGQMPCSRWSHCFSMNGGDFGDGFLVFGGVNLKNYCKSRIYQFQILNKWYTPKVLEERNEIDEKLEMLFSSVKEKIDIIKDNMNKEKNLNQSLTSSSKEDRKRRRQAKKATFLRTVFLCWKAYTKQIVRDKQLFFSIREFIIKRLSKKGFNSFKIYYVQSQLVKHLRYRKSIQQKHRYLREWNTQLQIQRQRRIILSRMALILERRIAFKVLKDNMIAKKRKQVMKMRLLRYWSKTQKRKVLRAFQFNIQLNQQKRENALKLMLFEQSRLARYGLEAFKANCLLSKREKRNKFKALRYFSKLYKQKSLKGFQANVEIQRFSKHLEYLKCQYDLTNERKILTRCLRAINSFKNRNQDNKTILLRVVEKIEMKQGFIALMRYLEWLKDIEELMIKRRWFNMLKIHKQIIENRRVQLMIASNNAERYYQKIGMMGFQHNKKISFVQRQQLNSLIERLSLKKAIYKIQSYAENVIFLREFFLKFEKRILKSVFLKFHQSSKLQVLNDTLLQRINLRLRLFHWKEIACEDKRLLKLMARAQKHRNRVLKKKSFILLKKQTQPPVEVLPKKRLLLLRLCFAKLKEYRIRHRVKNHKSKKARLHHRRQLELKFFQKFKAYSKMQRGMKFMESNNLYKVERFRRNVLMKKSLKALQKVVNMKRILNYYQQKFYFKFATQLLNKIQEGFISQRAKNLKKHRAENFYRGRILYKYFEHLQIFHKQKQLQKFKLQKSTNHYCLQLARKSLFVLYTNAQHKSSTSQMIQAALQERLQTQMRQIFTKLLNVGIYWAQIKGRFGSESSSRVYLGMKYGYRWRAKTLLRRFNRLDQRGQNTQMRLPLQQVNRNVTESVSRLIQSSHIKQSNRVQMPQTTGLPPRVQISSIQQSRARNQEQEQSQRTFNAGQSRLKEIEKEIIQFKKKKLLLKELEDQLNSQQNDSLKQLLKGKIDALKKELLQVQPQIRILLNEITQIKANQAAASQSMMTFGSDQSFILSKTMNNASQFY